MDEKYIKLFIELAHSLELLTERAMEEEKDSGDTENLKTAILMRKNYMEIYDKMRKNGIDQLTIKDFAHLYVASGILVNQLESKKKTIEKAIQGYKIDILPKLNRILNETKEDTEAIKLAKELFSINEDKTID